MYRFRYLLLILIVFGFAMSDTTPARAYGAEYRPIIQEYGAEFRVESVILNKSGTDTRKLNTPELVEPAKTYKYVPSENLYSDEFVNPPSILSWQMGNITRWSSIVDTVIEKYPNVDKMLILGMIAQESQGNPDMECNNFDAGRGTCAVGVMGITPGRCGLTASQLENPTKNIDCGAKMIDQIYNQALEHGFKPGREATRAALGAYNCSWPSLLSNNCYSFGGFAYADKVLNYWTPLLLNYLGE